MPVTPYSAGSSRRVHPAPTTPAAKPRRLHSATQTPPSQKTPQRLLGASSPYNTPVRHASAGSSNCACWHGKQPPPWRVAWSPSPYLEDLTKTLVVAPPVRRRLQLVPAVRLKTASVSPYEPPRDASARASRHVRAQLQVESDPPPPNPLRQRSSSHAPSPSHPPFPAPPPRTRQPPRATLQAELAERHNRLLWEREAQAHATELGMDLYTYNTLLSMQHRDITPEDYDVLKGLDESLQKKTMTQEEIDARLPSFAVADIADDADAPTSSGSDGGAPAPAAALQQCTICLERFETGQRARRLPCAHVFHAECVDRWLTGSSCVCPGCGKGVKPEPNTAAGAKRPEVAEKGDEGCAPIDKEAGY